MQGRGAPFSFLSLSDTVCEQREFLGKFLFRFQLQYSNKEKHGH